MDYERADVELLMPRNLQPTNTDRHQFVRVFASTKQRGISEYSVRVCVCLC